MFKGKHIDLHTKSILRKKPILIREIMDDGQFNGYPCKIIYPYSASFLKYIREVYGMKKLKLLYKKIRRKNKTLGNIKILERGLEKKIGQIQRDFVNYIKR